MSSLSPFETLPGDNFSFSQDGTALKTPDNLLKIPYKKKNISFIERTVKSGRKCITGYTFTCSSFYTMNGDYKEQIALICIDVKSEVRWDGGKNK